MSQDQIYFYLMTISLYLQIKDNANFYKLFEKNKKKKEFRLPSLSYILKFNQSKYILPITYIDKRSIITPIIKCINLVFLFFIFAIFSTLDCPVPTSKVIINIGKIKIRLYKTKYQNPNPAIETFSDLSKPRTTKYGPEEHGNKNKLTKIPITNAPIGETADCIIFIIFGLQAIGTSIKNHSPYQK